MIKKPIAVFFIVLTKIFRLEHYHIPVHVIPIGFILLILSENPPAKEIHYLKPGILMRTFMINIQWDIRGNKASI